MRVHPVLGLLLLASTCWLARPGSAQPLTDEQQMAAVNLANQINNATMKLAGLRAGQGVLPWNVYKETTLDPLNAAIAAAQGAHLPASAPIPLLGANNLIQNVPFSEAMKRASAMEGEITKAFEQKDDPVAVFKNTQSPEMLARYEKFKRPYEQALSGDKLKIMEEAVLINSVVYAEDPPRFIDAYYGEGKKLLRTPADFAKARIWANTGYAYATDDPLKRNPRWYLDIRRFEGMKLIKQDSLRGPGATAPEKLFK